MERPQLLRPFFFANMPNDALINPLRLKGDPQLSSGPCLLLINPQESRYALQEARKQGMRSLPLFYSNLIETSQNDSKSYWAGPAIGSPFAVMTLEKLIALGITKCVILGWCGALVDSLQVGDVVLPTWGKSEEGTSRHYPVDHRAESSKNLRNALTEYLEAHDVSCTAGPVWTTDALYRETRSKINTYASQSILAVDMEFSALATVAAFRGIEMAAALLVSDELYHNTWQPGFNTKSFRKQSRHLFSIMAKFLFTLE